MINEAYGQTHYGTKYPKRKKKFHYSEQDAKNRDKTDYFKNYGL